MNYRLAVLTVLIMAFTATACSMETHQTKIYFGETVEMQDYEIRYESDAGEAELTFGEWTDTSFLIHEEFRGSEIYEAEGEPFNVSDELKEEILRNGYDEDGRFVELSITGASDVFSSGEISSSTPDNLIISQGESAQIPLTLSNTGFLNQSYDLRAETNSSLSVSYSFQDFNVSDVYIPEGEENSLTALVEVPETAELGRYDLRLVAESEDTELSESFQVEIRGAEVEKDISLDVQESYTQTTAGETIEIPLTVRNGGSLSYVRPGMDEGPVLENVQFDVSVPDGWNYELNPEGYSQIDSRGAERSVLTVEVPENAQTGDFFIEVSASSDETSTEEPVEIRANVREQNQMGIVGVALMVLSLGLLVFVYRKFGRR